MIEATKKQNLDSSIRFMCATAGVSASGFRRWRNNDSAVNDRHEKLAEDIKAVWRESGCIYGSDRVHAELIRQGRSQCCERTVRKIMVKEGWSSVHPKRWRCTTQSDGTPRAEDLIKQDFTATRPGVRLVGDITQIDTWEGPLFLATVIDLYSREIIGYAIDDNHKADLVCKAVVMARQNRRIRRRAVFHSDRGSEYTSRKFRKCLKNNGRIRPSMGLVGCAYDNAAAESFFATLKKECVHPTVFATRQQAETVVGDYIEQFYNTRRLHTTIGYRPPAEARKTYKQRAGN